nr:hypothetical protein [Tanacetum cinerariifolium]
MAAAATKVRPTFGRHHPPPAAISTIPPSYPRHHPPQQPHRHCHHLHHSSPRHLLHHRDHSNSGGFSSRYCRRGRLWVADWPPPPRGCPSPNHHRGGGRMTVHHHSRTLWCRAMMAQPLGVSHSGQPPKTTDVVAAEPTLNTTAAPSGVGLVVVFMLMLAWMGVWHGYLKI